MPGARDPDQTIMTVSLSKRLLGIVDNVRKVNRAQFIRDAVAEKLSSMGIAVPGQVLNVPDRVKKRYPAPDLVLLNCKISEDTSPAQVGHQSAKGTAKKRAKKKA